MVFSSIDFLFIFLPQALAVFLVSRKLWGMQWAVRLLAWVSVGFYAQTSHQLTWLFLGSVVLNYAISTKLRTENGPSRPFFALAITLNLGLLFWFKYAPFASYIGMDLGLWSRPLVAQVLPLGISFYTFSQITYLVDRYRGIAPRCSFSDYLLFVSFFPHLIAGPILHHSQLMPQFKTCKPTMERFALGLFIFAIGFAKKKIIADSVAPLAETGFGLAMRLQGSYAWITVLAYTVQLYFDFSGYSDMAVGLGKMFGIDLPWNFLSPYRATSVADFWRRWHITLSAFLRQYVYIPLGGSRCSPVRLMFNLLVTMLLAGLWHGAGWTFVAWGALHGVALAVCHFWQRQTRWRFSAVAGWMLTMAVVLPGWIFFRCSNLDEAHALLAGLQATATGAPIAALDMEIEKCGFYVLCGLLIALLFPNAKSLSANFTPAWRTTCWTALLLALGVIFELGQKREPLFLYFNF